MPNLFEVSGYKNFFLSKELNKLLEFVSAEYFLICREWKERFKVKEIRFYC